MIVQEIQLKSWMDAYVEATLSFASMMLGISEMRILKSMHPELRQSSGANIHIFYGDQALQMSFHTNDMGKKAIAQAFLGLPGEEELPDDLTADAMREIANIIAGDVKTRMTNTGSLAIRLGLPFVGQCVDEPAADHITTDMQMGTVPSRLAMEQVNGM